MKYHVFMCIASIIAGFVGAKSSFYNCDRDLSGLKSDSDALSLIKSAVEGDQQYKFSSECLEILLRKNFWDSATYLLDEYYPNTSIDTEVIAKKVQDDVKRQQDYLIFLVK